MVFTTISEVKDSDQVLKIPMYFTVAWMVSLSINFTTYYAQVIL
jgi:hypothetical protein